MALCQLSPVRHQNAAAGCFLRFATLATRRQEVASAAGDAKGFWTNALAKGVVEAAGAVQAGSALATVSAEFLPKLGTLPELSLQLSASRGLGDGSQANTALLQECPDPIGKVTWDNYLAIGITDAKAHGIKDGDLVSLEVSGQEARTRPGASWPSQRFRTLPRLGSYYAGVVADDADAGSMMVSVTLNAYRLQGAGTQRSGLVVSNLKVVGDYKLANTQGHNYTEGRNIAPTMCLISTVKT